MGPPGHPPRRRGPLGWHFDIDEYLNPFFPPFVLHHLPSCVSHFLGHRTHPPRHSIGNVLMIFWAVVGIFASLACIGAISASVPAFKEIGVPTIIGSFVRLNLPRSHPMRKTNSSPPGRGSRPRLLRHRIPPRATPQRHPRPIHLRCHRGGHLQAFCRLIQPRRPPLAGRRALLRLRHRPHGPDGDRPPARRRDRAYGRRRPEHVGPGVVRVCAHRAGVRGYACRCVVGEQHPEAVSVLLVVAW
jgi:hypothetical protein